MFVEGLQGAVVYFSLKDKVYDITHLTGCSQNILENMQISASIVLQDNSNKKWKKKECQDLLSLHYQEVNSIYFLSALT